MTGQGDDLLAELAEAAGVQVNWRDVHGQHHEVAPPTLRAVLAAIGLPAGSDAEARDSLERTRRERHGMPSLLTATAGEALRLPGRFRIALEQGGSLEGSGEAVVDQPGYHRLEADGAEATLAVAPRRCHGPPDGRPWGVAVQLYALRRPGDGGIGDFGALRDFAGPAARHGADAVAISPVHAQFSADPDRFSPYSPSSRIMLNVLHADSPAPDPYLEAANLVDWPAAARMRLARFRTLFESGHLAAETEAFRRELGEKLEAHARFEALHAQRFGADPGQWHWRSWPAGLREPTGPAVARFAAEHPREVAFHAFLQYLADRGLASAQAACRAAGMRVGLVSDLAVGADGGGSHAWSRQDEMLIGLTVGAPPDLLSPVGQNWGLSTFSPRGLALNGFGAFIEMLQSALRHAGGVRIDHVMGLQRLWVLPEGASAVEGAYLSFPADDLMRLLALESHRHQALVLGEDLGTLPHGFRERMTDGGVMGMRVLWFERDGDRFIPPAHWPSQATAMTSTHDLPTLAGWWSGRDITWRTQIGFVPDPDTERRARAADRARLLEAMRESGAAQGEPPDSPGRFADAACAYVAGGACSLALLPLEDLLALSEQPNLPGTTDAHPNWRRRTEGNAADLLDLPEVSARTGRVRAARGG
jgi:4-alpha-glucanotransferase